MITPDDPRHGDNKGYNAGCRRPCCRAAHADYRRHLRTRQYLNGGPLTLSIRGTHRRLQALTALGWCLEWIDAELGQKRTYCQRVLARPADATIFTDTAARIAEVYDRLSMRLPDESTASRRNVASRARNAARSKGWAPPLAWDDIDNDSRPTIRPTSGVAWEDQVDHAVVRRVLDTGTKPRRLTRAEAGEVVHGLLLRGQSTHQIENEFGFKTERYTRTEVA